MQLSDSKNWFDVDRRGLSKLIERRGKVWLLHELISNAWDADNVNRVDVKFSPCPGVAKVWVTVTDNAPDGFADLSHAWTLFAESNRKSASNKRGRFNLGEKLVLALCDEATIITTTSGVRFDSRGRTVIRTRRKQGSEFSGLARITRAELVKIRNDLKMLIPPKGIDTFIDGELLPSRQEVSQFETTLPTEIADEEGILKRSARKCQVSVYEPLPGEIATIYEMGIPVVESGMKWSTDISIKVPLNMNRDNVTPSYLLKLQVAVANHLHDKLTDEDVKEPWVAQAVGSPDIEEDAFTDLQVKYHGKTAVVYDPSDKESNFLAVAEGRPLIYGGSMSKGVGKNNRRFGTHLPAGQVTPSPKPFDRDGEPLKIVDEDDWTPDMRTIAEYTKRVGQMVLHHPLSVVIARDRGWPFAACYSKGEIILNYSKLGKKWFASGASQQVNRLLTHEFAHHYAECHLSKEFYDACCKVGAAFTALALSKPELFNTAG